MTEYTITKPKSDFSKKDEGGDESVRYKGGKRQDMKANYKHGKQPRGTGTIGSGGTQTKGIGKA